LGLLEAAAFPRHARALLLKRFYLGIKAQENSRIAAYSSKLFNRAKTLKQRVVLVATHQPLLPSLGRLLGNRAVRTNAEGEHHRHKKKQSVFQEPCRGGTRLHMTSSLRPYLKLRDGRCGGKLEGMPKGRQEMS
jgi:hypothetical protein